MAREPIPTWYFALAVVRRGNEFLLVQERKHGQLWYLPAGRAECGETLAHAAIRETLEEAGIPIRLTGVVRVEHSPHAQHARLRVIFLAEPIDNVPPKQVPDEESLRAEWVPLDRLDAYPLRGPEIADLLAYVAKGGPVAPLDVLQWEGTPYDSDVARANEEL